MKGSIFILSLKWLGATGFVALLAAILFPVFATGSNCGGRRTTCLVNLKQLMVSVAMYQSDCDDRLPPHFTFDGPEQAQKFVNVTIPYAKLKEIYLCPSDSEPFLKGQEGLSGVMSYVHCLSFKSKIPDYDAGNRIVRVTEPFPNIATTPFLRDPIRSASFSGPQSFSSPNGNEFTVAYLDTHVKFRKPLDINTEL
jgi:hypothetical protein